MNYLPFKNFIYPILGLISFLVQIPLQAQKVDWVEIGIGSNISKNQLAVGPEGAVYFSAEFEDLYTWKGDTFKEENALGLHSGNHCFIYKLDKYSNTQWRKVIKARTSGYIHIENLEVDNRGDVLVHVFFTNVTTNDTLIFSPDTTIVKPHEYSYAKRFIIKYDSEGNLLWLRGYPTNTHIRAFDFDRDNNIYFVGNMDSYARVGDDYYTCGEDSAALFLMKYSPEGNLVWFKPTIRYRKYENPCEGLGIAIDSMKNIIINGNSRCSVCYVDTIIYYSNGASEAYIAKFDSLGNYKWLKKPWKYGTLTKSIKVEVVDPNTLYWAIDMSSGNFNLGNGVIVQGYYGPDNFILARLDSLGLAQWAINNSSTYPGSSLKDITSNKDGDIFLSGMNENYKWLALGNFKDTIENATGFIAKINPEEKVEWLNPIGYERGFFSISKIRSMDNGQLILLGGYGRLSNSSYDYYIGDENITIEDSVGFYLAWLCDSVSHQSKFSANTNNGLQIDLLNESPITSSWQWHFGDGQIDSTNWNTSHTFNSPGMYEAYLVSQSACGADTSFASIRVYPLNSTDKDILNSGHVSVYPNPSKGLIELKLGENYADFQYEISGVAGEMIMSPNSCTSEIETISLEKYQPGIYILKLTSKKEQIHFKIIKE